MAMGDATTDQSRVSQARMMRTSSQHSGPGEAEFVNEYEDIMYNKQGGM